MNPVPSIIMGCDPGLHGAISFFCAGNPKAISCYDIPIAAHEVDGGALAALIRTHGPDMAIIERASSRPAQGVHSVFVYGSAYGVIRGVIAALDIPTHLVAAATWKKFFKLKADKEEARGLAVRFWPSSTHFRRVCDHHKAESALLARFGAETIWRGGSL